MGLDGIGLNNSFLKFASNWFYIGTITYNSVILGAKEIDIAATVEHLRDQRPSMVKTKVRDITFLCAMCESGLCVCFFYHCYCFILDLACQLLIIFRHNALLVSSLNCLDFFYLQHSTWNKRG